MCDEAILNNKITDLPYDQEGSVIFTFLFGCLAFEAVGSVNSLVRE